MPSDNNANSVTMPDKGKKGKDKKNHKSIGWIIGVVVLILISVTFVLPTTIFSSSNSQRITFGRYNGQDIYLEMTYDNYFYNQLYSLTQQNPMTAQNMMQLYAQAFYQTVFNTALSQYAEEASIRVSDRMLSSAVVSSGLYRDENGVFSMDLYNAASNVDREAVRDQIRDNLPSQMVLDDIISVKTSNAELDFVSSLNASPRGFEYIVVDYHAYPNEDAAAYATENPAPFTAIALTSATFPTEEDARAAFDEITANGITLSDAVADSAIEAVDMGSVLYHDFEDTLVNSEEAATVYALEEGNVAGPIQTFSGWTLYEAGSNAALADLADQAILDDVKEYIQSNDSTIMNDYLAVASEAIYSEAVEDFDATIENHEELTGATVASASYNPSSASFINGISGNDSGRTLSNAVLYNSAFHRELFTADEYAVVGPVSSGNAYVIARPVPASSANSGWTSYLNLMYAASTQQLAANDLQTTIMASDSFEDNFLTTYITDVMGAGSSN